MIRAFLLILFFAICMQLSAQDYDLSNGQYFDGEPFLAIDPHSPGHIVVAWMGYTVGSPFGIKVKVSFDGGHSWSASTFLPHLSPTYHSADPSLMFDTAGNVWACYIDSRQSPDSGAVWVVRSPDGGLTWGMPRHVIDVYADGSKLPVDRPWLSINPVNNHFYVTTKPAPWIPAPNRPYLSVSTDGGTTWTWRYVDTTGYLTGSVIQAPMAVPVTGSDGILHIVYPTYLPSQNLLAGYIHASSTDDGASFSYHAVGYSATTAATDTLAKIGYHLTVDPSDPLHLSLDFINSKTGDQDVYLVESHDGGLTWSTFIRINDDPSGNGKMQDLSWCGFDDNGDLVAGWRDRRNAPGTGYSQPSEIWGAVKRKDSTAFSPNLRISDTIAPFNATYLDANGNDFMSIAMHSDTMYAVWGDVRTNKLNIWFVKRGLASGTSTGILLTDEAVADVSVYPTPAGDKLYIHGSNVTNASISDPEGRTLGEVPIIGQSIDISSLPRGIYLIRLQTATGSATQRFVKE